MSNVRIIEVEKKIQEKNDLIANRIREKKGKIPMIDIMGSVGSGKTSILEFFANKYMGDKKFLVINGDLATDIDAQRIGRFGSTCLQINTGRGCHLMAYQVEQALDKVDLEEYDFIFVENVGNLICPSTTDVGADFKMIVTSVTEGPYVFEKHPVTFKIGKLAVINKVDLAEAMEINPQDMVSKAKKIYPHLDMLVTSTKTGEGMDELARKIGLKK